jgi:perosamine synthetase
VKSNSLFQVPVNTPLITSDDQKAVAQCMQDGWVSSEGPVVHEFENTFSDLVGRKYGVAVANGTAALEITLRAVGLEQGDEVILPTFMIISCALAVINAGCKPVFVDADRLTWNIDPFELKKSITNRTKAILVAHVYHFPADMDAIIALAHKHDLMIIEDAAEMHGQTYRSKMCGSFGVASTFSFYANKTITTGEGGMIVTDNLAIAERCSYLRNLCFNNKVRFKHTELSGNYRLTSLQAALGLSQSKRLSELVEQKRKIGRKYDILLSGIQGLELPEPSMDFAENIYWVYGILLKKNDVYDAKALRQKLQSRGVSTRPFFFPLHRQPALKNVGVDKSDGFPIANDLYERGFYIPSGLGITDVQQNFVCDVLHGLMGEVFASH